MSAPVVSLVDRLRNGGQPDLADMAQGLMDAGADAVGAIRAAAALMESQRLLWSADVLRKSADSLMAALVMATVGKEPL